VRPYGLCDQSLPCADAPLGALPFKEGFFRVGGSASCRRVVSAAGDPQVAGVAAAKVGCGRH
jgi:hypothetical protein